MRNIFFSSLIFTLFTAAAEARDQVAPAPESSQRLLEYNALDGTIMSPGHQYPPTIQGLRQYLNQELTENDKDYRRLNPKLEALEQQDRLAFNISLIPTGLGIGSLLLGSALRQDEEPVDPREKSIHDQGGRLMLYGLGGILGGFILNELLSPDKDDLHHFIQIHNAASDQPTTPSARNPRQRVSIKLFDEDSVMALNYKF